MTAMATMVPPYTSVATGRAGGVADLLGDEAGGPRDGGDGHQDDHVQHEEGVGGPLDERKQCGGG